jgi:hypothetical protein
MVIKLTKIHAQPNPTDKLNKKLNIKFGKESLELADRVLMGPGGKKIDEYVLREA